MYNGTMPLFTKGPLALFYGGEEILSELSDKTAGNGLPILLIATIMFQLSMYIYEKYHMRQLQNMTVYVKNLRTTLVKNVLNVYGVVLLLFFNLLGFIFVMSFYFLFGQENNRKEMEILVPSGIYFLALLLLISVIWPYRSHALR